MIRNQVKLNKDGPLSQMSSSIKNLFSLSNELDSVCAQLYTQVQNMFESNTKW